MFVKLQLHRWPCRCHLDSMLAHVQASKGHVHPLTSQPRPPRLPGNNRLLAVISQGIRKSGGFYLHGLKAAHRPHLRPAGRSLPQSLHDARITFGFLMSKKGPVSKAVRDSLRRRDKSPDQTTPRAPAERSPDPPRIGSCRRRSEDMCRLRSQPFERSPSSPVLPERSPA